MRSTYATMRYGSNSRNEDYDLDGNEYEEEESYRESRRKDRNATAMTNERRRQKSAFDVDRNMESMHRFSKSSRDVYYQSEKDRYDKFDAFDRLPKDHRSDSHREHVYFDNFEDTPHPSVGKKFNFDPPDQGFESDFNTAPTEKALRFSNDFSDKESPRPHQQQQQQPTTPSDFASPAYATTPQQKLRFDDKITVSKFESNSDRFEDDDFSKAEFSFENEDQWIEELPKKNNLKMTNKRSSENIKKSESVNIFAKNQEDPFEDDDFFKSASPDNTNGSNNRRTFLNNNNSKNNNGLNSITTNNNNNTNSKNSSNSNNSNNNNNNNSTFKWENNFAKFDDNI